MRVQSLPQRRVVLQRELSDVFVRLGRKQLSARVVHRRLLVGIGPGIGVWHRDTRVVRLHPGVRAELHLHKLQRTDARSVLPAQDVLVAVHVRGRVQPHSLPSPSLHYGHVPRIGMLSLRTAKPRARHVSLVVDPRTIGTATAALAAGLVAAGQLALFPAAVVVALIAGWAAAWSP